MTIKKAKRSSFILAGLGLACLIGAVWSKWCLLPSFLLLTAAAVMRFRYCRCPHCGKTLIRRSYAWDPAGVCPCCGKPVDENTIIE